MGENSILHTVNILYCTLGTLELGDWSQSESVSSYLSKNLSREIKLQWHIHNIKHLIKTWKFSCFAAAATESQTITSTWPVTNQPLPPQMPRLFLLSQQQTLSLSWAPQVPSPLVHVMPTMQCCRHVGCRGGGHWERQLTYLPSPPCRSWRRSLEDCMWGGQQVSADTLRWMEQTFNL